MAYLFWLIYSFRPYLCQWNFLTFSIGTFLGPSITIEECRDYLVELQENSRKLIRFEKSIIAAINGYALGLGYAGGALRLVLRPVWPVFLQKNGRIPSGNSRRENANSYIYSNHIIRLDPLPGIDNLAFLASRKGIWGNRRFEEHFSLTFRYWFSMFGN